MIKLSNITKKFGTTPAVQGISFKIKPGEIVGLLGPNGAGKTTTLRMMAGVLPPTKGEIELDGKNFNDHPDIKTRIGYLPEDNPLYEELTVEEHLHFWAQMKGMDKENAEKAIAYAIEKTGIKEVYYRLIGELSKGYQQRVGLAQAILGKPDILLLDEPTEGLDPNQRRDIQDLLNELKKSRTVIVSSHVLSEISKIANRIIIISQGKVVGDDSPENLIKNSDGVQEVEIEIQGIHQIKEIKGIPGVKEVIKEQKGKYRIRGSADLDLRPQIFKAAVKNKWILLTMKSVERQLEEVFSELTE